MARPESQTGEVDSESYIDAPRLMRELSRRKGSILIPTALAAGAGLLFVMAVPPRYTGVAKVVLENQETYLTRPDKAENDAASPLDEEAVQSASEALSTPDIARKAIDKLSLAANPEFHPSGFELIVSALIGGSRSNSGDVAVDTFLNHETIFPIARSRVIQIEFSSKDPALAARGANTLADLFLDSRADAKQSEAKSAATWLASRIEPMRAKVAEAEQALEAYRGSSGLLTGANGMTTPTQRLSDLTTQAAALRAQQSAAAAKAQTLRDLLRAGKLDAIADAAHDDSLRRYEEARVALKAQISELSRTLLPQHPRMKELLGQLAGLEDEMRSAATKAVHGFEEDARTAADQVRNLDSAIADQSRVVSSGDGATVKLRSLELDAKTAREQLEAYIDKYREALARQSEGAGPANARIIETASPPRDPSFPKRTPTVLLAALAGFFLSLGVASARALLADGEPQRRVIPARRSPYIDAPVVAQPAPAAVAVERSAPIAEPVAPAIEPEKIKTDAELDIAIEGFVAESPQEPLTLLVTGEGSRAALAIALAAARRLATKSSAALLDLGMSQSWLGDVVERDGGEAAFLGLSDLVKGGVDFERVLHRDLSSRLDIIPPGPDEVEPDELTTILAALSESYDYVVVHASDWRTPLGRAALQRANGVMLCALQPRLGPMRERVQWVTGARKVFVVTLATEKKGAIERAA